MRVILSNLGTHGDIQPFLALGLEMAKHGHHPVVVSSSYFRPIAERLGLEFHALGPDLRPAIFNINMAIISRPEVSHSVEALTWIGAALTSQLFPMYRELLHLSDSAGALVCGQMQPAGRMVHDATGIPFASMQLTNLGSRGTAAYRHATEALINPARAEAGLPALDDPLTTGNESPQLSLYAFSRHVRPRQLDWPAHAHVCGYLFLDDSQWAPDAALEEFLRDGEPPVAVTFGSNMISQGDRFTELIVRALNRTGRRFLIQRGWSELAIPASPPHAMCVGYVPHEWLFPRCACVVHHGGAGTSGSVFRAGVPGVFVPHAFDQFAWSEFAADLGCSPRPVPFRDLTEDLLAEAIVDCLRNPSYALRARHLASLIAAEDGCARARRLIEQLVAATSGESEKESPARLQQQQVRRRAHIFRQRSRR